MSTRPTSTVAISPIAISIVRRAPFFAVVSATLMLGACASAGGDASSLLQSNAPKAIDTAEKAAPKSELQKATEYWGKQHGENPTDPRSAVNYAKNLKAMGAKREALVILQEFSRHNPTDREIMSEYGRLALEHDQISTAQALLEKADDPMKPDWKIVSARGTVFAKQGRHEESIPFFERARSLAPDQPTVLNNLAMAYAMNGEAAKAETMLRDAQAKNPEDQRIAHNLALVLGLQGKHADAERMAATGGSGDTVAHNADVMRQIVGRGPQAEPAIATETAPRPTPVAAKGAAGIPTASMTKAKAKAKSAEPAPVDAAELVRQMADRDAASTY